MGVTFTASTLSPTFVGAGLFPEKANLSNTGILCYVDVFGPEQPTMLTIRMEDVLSYFQKAMVAVRTKNENHVKLRCYPTCEYKENPDYQNPCPMRVDHPSSSLG